MDDLAPAAAKFRSFKRFALTGLGATFLVFVWRFNYDHLGNFFDYSIVSSAAGYLHAGLKPYRDFTTPLQSLTIYLGYLAEGIFGKRYLSLAYGNLTLGLGFFVAMIGLLKNRVSMRMSVGIATALMVASFFQHGILWYNSIALGLSVLIVWISALIYRTRMVNPGPATALCWLLFLSSMCKLNFHLLNLGLAGLILAALLFRIESEQQRKIFIFLPVLFFCGTVPGPLTEILINHTTLHNFYQNVLLTPRGRFHLLAGIWKLDTYTGSAWDFYPGNTDNGLYLCGVIIFGALLYLLLFRGGNAEKSKRSRRIVTITILATILAMFFAALFLTLTNKETTLLTGSFLLAGLVAIFLMFGPDLNRTQTLALRVGIYFFVCYFILAGSIAAHRHSRLRFMESNFSDPQERSSHKNSYSEEDFQPLNEFSQRIDDLEKHLQYFQGVRFTPFGHEVFSKLDVAMQQENLYQHPERVYYGPGFEILNRLYDTYPKGLPLWYDLNATVREEDSARIIAAMKQNHFERVAMDSIWRKELPAEVSRYMDNNYNRTCRQKSCSGGL